MFSVRLVKADHYMNAPISGLDVRYSEFRAVEVKQVPVIRIFGSTPSGQKVCVHVHGVFPYIYIPYDGLVARDRFLYEVASGIDKALNISLGNSNSSNQHVYKITLVSAIPFYGYHSKTHQFLKIFFYNPLMVKKASDLLQNGVILGQIFQPHEAHLPFILQFCIDYNLHGMSFVHFSTVRYRQGRIEGSEIKIASLQGIPEELFLPENILRLSTCNLEVDAVAADIINQKEISGHLARNPGLQSIWNEEKQRRRKENHCSQFTPQNSQPRSAPLTSSEVFHLDRLKKHLGLTALLKENVENVLEKSFSGDKPKPYPAPTPAGENLLDASMLHTHINSLNSDKTCNTLLHNSTVLKDSNVHIDEREVLSVTSSQNQLESSQSSFLNSQGLSLVHALQELVEDDSVLGSQTLAIDENNKEEVNDDDMSQLLNVNEQEVSSNCTSPLRHSGAEYEEQTLCEQNNPLVVSSDQVLSSDLTNSRLKSDQDKHPCKSSRGSALFSSGDKESVLDETCHKNSTIHSSLKPFFPDNFTGNDSAISDNFEVKDKLENSLKSHDLNVQEISSSQHSFPVHVKFCTVKYENGLQILSLKKSPPNKKQVRNSLKILHLPNEQFLEPFFSNHSDVIEKKEVGFKDLKINSHNVHELETFESSIGVTGLEMYRYDAISNLWDVSQTSHDDPKHAFKSRSMKCALASHRETIITLNVSPPCVAKVKSWAKAREAYKESIKETNLEYKLHDLACSVGKKTCDSSDIALLNYHKIVESENDCETASSAIDKHDPINFYESKLKNKSLSIFSSHQESTTNTFSKEDSPLFCVSEMKNLHEVQNQQYCSNANIEQVSEKVQVHEQFTTPCEGNDSISHNSLGYKLSYQNLQDCRAVMEPQYLTILTVEIHVQTRGDLLPDPAHDSVCAVFYSIQNDVANNSFVPTSHTGMIIVQRLTSCSNNCPIHSIASGSEVKYVPDERTLMEEVINLVRQWDPDILAGYEVEMLSWGYLFERAFALQLNLCSLVSRIPGAHQRSKTKQLFDESESESPEDLSLLGRIVLNVWRLMRHEVALQSYTFENIAFHVLHERVPLHSFKTLTQWWGHRTSIYWGRVVDHYLLRVLGLLRIINQLDLINRTSELARIFGIQFYEVLSRGSQFRVESMMLRLAKPMNYIPVSPSIQQRARMRAPEYLQLIMEPESKLYVDPVIVLDFQSLYPSMIIAYNYCFSTCLGRVEHLGQSSPFEFGSSHLRVPPDEVKSYLGNINISPCGVAFVKANIRKGILPQMLEEILETRLMVKATMKRHKNDKALQRILHSRQLGLKLIANVTYGYTAANFSGRMACVEVADSVVSKGRETLERAINLVENTPRWGARVLYGDTDSMFVLVPGRSRQDAFEIGAEIAEAVTFDNPTPVKLKLEKVYQPCLLQTKKRYVGYMYESAAQKDPVYDAKGIETVRRDGCPAVAKILEKSLRLLFETKDVSKVKSYVQNKFTKLLEGQMSLQDLIFAREYRGSNGYKPGACVPALELTKRWLTTDPRAEPRVSERVPYVIVSGAPNVPLIRLVRAPKELLMEPSLHVHAHYYISRVICPPLSRCFSLIGCDVLSWYTDLPRRIMLSLPKSISFNDQRKKITISQYFSTSNCLICYQICQTGICSDCQMQPQKTSVILAEKLHNLERNLFSVGKICHSCCGFQDTVKCISLDCPVMYQRLKAHHTISQEYFLRHHLENLSS